MHLLTDGDELNPSLDPSQSCEYSVTAIEVGFIQFFGCWVEAGEFYVEVKSLPKIKIKILR